MNRGREQTNRQGSWFFPMPLCLSEVKVFSLGSQIFWFIKGGCWAAKILLIHFDPNSVRNASLWNLRSILQFFQARTKTSLTISWHLISCLRYSAPGNRSFFPESEERMDYFLPSEIVGCILALVGGSQL